tara:strand:+ start:1189 stop:2040 length:852 start_codon:yes stop_codon:yes gene_type:complete
MSTLELENIKHPDNSGNNIELAADGTIGGISITGNVGIGTASPEKKLHVKYDGTGGVKFESTQWNIVDINSDSDDNGSNDDTILRFTNGSNNAVRGEIRFDESSNTFELGHGDNQNHIAIASGGNVGIGTHGPTGKLQVYNGSAGHWTTTGTDSRNMREKKWLRKLGSSATHDVAIVDKTSEGGSNLGSFTFTYTYRSMYGFNGNGGGHGQSMISGRCHASTGVWYFDTPTSTLQGDSPFPVLSCTDNGNNTATIKITNPSSTHTMGELSLIVFDCSIASPTY